MKKRAIFLDRDGTLNALVLNPQTGEYEGPRVPSELALMPGVEAAARRLQAAGFALFIVTNQPNYAKGKATLEDIHRIGRAVEAALLRENVSIARSFCCLHHPKGVVPEYSGECECRKPKPKLLFDARDQFSLDLSASWMVGDQESDVACGARAGCRTVLLENPLSASRRPGVEAPTLRALDLLDAAAKILSFTEARA